MEYEQQQPNPDDGFMNKVKESPRTVSAIIIVLIVAAAIYAFSGNNQNNTEELAENTVTPTPEASGTPENKDAATPATDKKETVKPTVAPSAPVKKETLADASKNLPSGKTTDNAYVEVAQKGDGLTHLARRAATRYLADHEAGYTLTNEHRIFIEDYVRKHVPKHRVTVGMEETISFDLVKQAVEAAGKLSAPQLKNLTKYTHALT